MLKPLVKTPAVGVAALIVHQHQVLIGRRIKAPMQGSWQLPGGWLRCGSTPQQALQAQIVGFTGMRVGQARFAAITDNHFDDELHTISLYYQLPCLNPNELDLSQNKACDEWCWAEWGNLPEPLFLPLYVLKQSGFRF
jgi:ADP-ribose pyrophosphatase YjhB (NUDIX family)